MPLYRSASFDVPPGFTDVQATWLATAHWLRMGIFLDQLQARFHPVRLRALLPTEASNLEDAMKRWTLAGFTVIWLWPNSTLAENPPPVLLKPARVFDGQTQEAHEGWVVLVRGEKIESAGPAAEVKVPDDARVIDLPGATLLPGLIEGHSHRFLHPYNQAPPADHV